jgi:hypothetical protein
LHFELEVVLILLDLRDVEDGLLAMRGKDDGRTKTQLQSRCRKVVWMMRHVMMLAVMYPLP